MHVYTLQLCMYVAICITKSFFKWTLGSYYLQLTNNYALSIERGHLKTLPIKGQVHLCRRASHYPNCLSSQSKAMIITLFQGKSQFAMQLHGQITIQIIMKMYSYVDNCINIYIILLRLYKYLYLGLWLTFNGNKLTQEEEY